MKATWAPSASDNGVYRFIALQPIFNRRKQTFGYEVLSRLGWNNRFIGDSDSATQMMIDNWMLHSLGELTGGLPGFMNCTREALVRGSLTMLPDSVVFELLETIEPDQEVLAACAKLKRLGYKIALDDFQLAPRMDLLVKLADFVKVDFRISDRQERREIFRCLKHCTAEAIAEKVETREEFEIALSEGFSLFQGYYLERPIVFSKRQPSTNNGHHFRLLAAHRQTN